MIECLRLNYTTCQMFQIPFLTSINVLKSWIIWQNPRNSNATLDLLQPKMEFFLAAAFSTASQFQSCETASACMSVECSLRCYASLRRNGGRRDGSSSLRTLGTYLFTGGKVTFWPNLAKTLCCIFWNVHTRLLMRSDWDYCATFYFTHQYIEIPHHF